jgi:hypothetical protein
VFAEPVKIFGYMLTGLMTSTGVNSQCYQEYMISTGTRTNEDPLVAIDKNKKGRL